MGRGCIGRLTGVRGFPNKQDLASLGVRNHFRLSTDSGKTGSEMSLMYAMQLFLLSQKFVWQFPDIEYMMGYARCAGALSKGSWL